MPQKIQDTRFSRREMMLDPFIDIETIEDVVRKTLSHLLGWNETDKKWLKLRCDTAGKLMVSGVSPAGSFVHNKISASDTESSVTLTENYTQHVIYNDGPYDVHVNFDATATTNSFKIPKYSSLSLSLEFKSLHVICASGETATVYWLALK